MSRKMADAVKAATVSRNSGARPAGVGTEDTASALTCSKCPRTVAPSKAAQGYKTCGFCRKANPKPKPVMSGIRCRDCPAFLFASDVHLGYARCGKCRAGRKKEPVYSETRCWIPACDRFLLRSDAVKGIRTCNVCRKASGGAW
jgi:hypothetical protein